MEVQLKPLCAQGLAQFSALHRDAFWPLWERYQDEGNPAHTTAEQFADMMQAPDLDFYSILSGSSPVGGIIVRRKEGLHFRLLRLFVDPAQQGKGIASQAIGLMEALYPQADAWELDTIAEETSNCHLYAKMGYRITGNTRTLQPGMALIDFIKPMFPKGHA